MKNTSIVLYSNHLFQKIRKEVVGAFVPFTVNSFGLVCVVLILAAVAYVELKPQPYTDKYAHCLELGSNFRTKACIDLLITQYPAEADSYMREVVARAKSYIEAGENDAAQSIVSRMTEVEYAEYNKIKQLNYENTTLGKK